MKPAFVVDPKVQAIAEAYASEAVNLAAKMLAIEGRLSTAAARAYGIQRQT